MTVDDADFLKKIRSDVPHSARVWNAWLGGKDNYPVDRELADAVTAAYPQMADIAQASRAFQARAVRHLAHLGVRQFLDVGTGLPVENSTHEVAQAVVPEARVVYVDNDPIVLVHAAALLTSSRRAARPTWTPISPTRTPWWTRPPRHWTCPGRWRCS